MTPSPDERPKKMPGGPWGLAFHFLINGLSLGFFFGIFLVFFSPSAFAQIFSPMQVQPSSEPTRVQADHVTYDKETNTYLAEGRVEIWQGNRKLTADRVRLNAREQEAEATGKVILVQGDDVLRGEEMKIDLDTSLGIVIRGTLFLKKQNYYLRGEEIERVGEETYRILGGNFTTCNADWPAWRFTGKEAIVTLEDYASIEGATFQVKNVPVLYSPYLVLPMKTQRQSGFLIPDVGYSNSSGFIFNNSFFWAINKHMDATFYLDVATKKGIGEGLEYRLAREKDAKGSLYAYHIRETPTYRARYTDVLDRKPDRWGVDVTDDETWGGNLLWKSRLLGFSDRQYFKDYGRTYEERAWEQAYSFVSLAKNWERYSLFGEARYTTDLRTEDKTTLQNLPVINFTGMQQQLNKSVNVPLYLGFTSSYGYYWRQEGTTGQRLDLYPTLSLPLKWANYLEITPQIGGRETYYQYSNGGENTHSRQLWDFSLNAATNFYRIFDTDWESAPKIKHWIRPEITYTYLPEVNQQAVPNFDAQVTKLNTITYGVTQRLTGKMIDKAGNSLYHEYAYLRVSQIYDIFEATRKLAPGSAPRRPLGPVTTDLKLISTKYFGLENNSTYDVNRKRLLTSYSAFNLNDGRGDSLSIEHRLQENVSDQVNGILRVKVLSSLDVFYGKRFSRFDKQPLETTYGVNYQHQCWGVDVSYSETPGIAGNPAEKKVMVMVNLLGVTSIGKR